MSNFEYISDNMSPNPDIVNQNNTIGNIVGAPNPGDHFGVQPSWTQYEVSYCNPQGASYFPIDNIIVNPEDLFKNNDKNIVQIKNLRENVYKILHKKSSFEDEEFNDDEIKDEKIDNLLNEIKLHLEQFDKIQEELSVLDEELKKEITSMNNKINKLEGVIDFILKLDFSDKEEEDDDLQIKQLIENIKKVSEKISKTEKFEEVKKKYASKRKELNKYIYLLTKLNSLNISNRCLICLDSTIDHYLDPCGHTMCKTCIEKNMRMNNRLNILNEQMNIETIRNYGTKCPVCRVTINEVRKLFLL